MFLSVNLCVGKQSDVEWDAVRLHDLDSDFQR